MRGPYRKKEAGEEEERGEEGRPKEQIMNSQEVWRKKEKLRKRREEEINGNDKWETALPPPRQHEYMYL